MQKKAFLLTLEGGEGSGKSSVGRSLQKHLESFGLVVNPFREPGSTRISEEIRDLLLSKRNEGLTYKAEALLFQAARAQFCEEELFPALEREGEIVLLDRFYHSSEAYQGGGRGLGRKKIRDLSLWTVDGHVPDLTLFFDVDAEVGLARKNKTGESNKMEDLGVDFHRIVNESYREIAREDGGKRWRVIDANQDLADVEREAISIVETELVGLGYIERPRGRLERR